jgi:hypothetical protein
MNRYEPLSKTDRTLRAALTYLVPGTARLKTACRVRNFTLDGRLVGDMGEFLAARYYVVRLYHRQTEGHDGVTTGNRRVQVKATFGKTLAIRVRPDYLLGFRLTMGGRVEEVFNGPGDRIGDLCDPQGRQRSLRVEELRLRNKDVGDRVPRRRRPLRVLTTENAIDHPPIEKAAGRRSRRVRATAAE